MCRYALRIFATKFQAKFGGSATAYAQDELALKCVLNYTKLNAASQPLDAMNLKRSSQYAAPKLILRAAAKFTVRCWIRRALFCRHSFLRFVQNGRYVLNFKILVKQAIYALVVIYAPDDLAEKRRDADCFDAVALLP